MALAHHHAAGTTTGQCTMPLPVLQCYLCTSAGTVPAAVGTGILVYSESSESVFKLVLLPVVLVFGSVFKLFKDSEFNHGSTVLRQLRPWK